MSTGSTSESPSVAATRLLQIIEARFGDGLATARPPSATGAGPDAEQLRRAYLDLLKLCLCDLCATQTLSVARTCEGLVMSRELGGDQLRLRAAGMDWPLQGLTMIGLQRLDDLQACVESVVRDGVEGDLIEAGTWRGGASLLMRATLDSLGEGRTVWVADSFQGFPRADSAGADGYDLDVDLAAVDFLAVGLDEVRANFARLGYERGVEFVPGFFQDTLPSLSQQRWSILRLDGDSYDATHLALRALYPNLAVGGYVIVDDYRPLDACRAAVDDFRSEHGIDEPIEEIDWSGVRWRRTSAAPIEVAASGTSAPHSDPPSAPEPVVRAPHSRIPSMREVDLESELQTLRQRLTQAQSEIDRLRGSPLYGPRTWLRRRLGQLRGSRR